jgi:hypothetical protein
MTMQIGFPMERSVRRLLLESWFLALAICAVACSQDIPVGGDTSQAAGKGVKLEDISRIDTDALGLIVHYRTRISIGDCGAQTSEMPQVWDLVVKDRLEDSAVQTVTLFPEDASGRSVAVTFTKNTSGQWSASAPCSISIPAASAPKTQ